MWRVLVFPFALIYGLIVWLRNKFFDWGILGSKQFDVPTISVGNLSAGGAGKTPHIEYLIRLLNQDYNLATLSRGYKRKTKGFRIAKQHATASEIGDEPSQLKHKFNKITVAVDEKRRRGIKEIKKLDPYVDIILMDDAFQHRYVKPGLNILVTDYHNPYSRDYLLPTGTLREHTSGAKRADIIIVSKTPNVLSPITKRRFYHELNPLPNQDLCFSYIKYGQLRPVFKSNNPGEIPQNFNSIIMVTAIANPYPLEDHLREKCYDLETITFPDHHKFSKSDIKKILAVYDDVFSPKKAIITTEKDATRLRSALGNEKLKDLPLYYVPVEVAFHKGQKQKFERRILKYVRENQGNQ